MLDGSDTVILPSQGIGGDSFPLYTYGIEEGDSGFDFVCLSFCFFFTGNVPTFFWVQLCLLWWPTAPMI